MANTDKNIVITPNIGSSTADPKIVFSGADSTTAAQNITLQIYPTNNGTLSFEGNAGQLFSITNSMSGTIYSVNDVSGIPSIEVLDTGLVKLAQYSGSVLIGTGTDNGVDKFQVNGSILGTVLKASTFTSTVATGTAPFTVTSTTTVTNLSADMLDGLHLHTGTNNEANKVVRTDASGYLVTGYINCAAGNEGNNSNPPRVWGTNGSDNYLRTYLTSALSVNYATSAGSATSATSATTATNLSGGTVSATTISDSSGNVRRINSAGTAKSTSYTLTVNDIGEFVEVTTGGSIVIPTSTFTVGDAITIFNNTTGGITITCSALTSYISGIDAAKTSVTLATRGLCTVMFISASVCVLIGSVV